MSGIINKVKDVVHQHQEKKEEKNIEQSGENLYSSNQGPHDSNTANAADPRVDSDRSNVPGSTTGYGSTQPTGYGAHDSNIANKTDPRVDSGLDNTRTSHSHHTGAPTGTTTGSNFNESTNRGYGSNQSTNYGPHDSNLANKADPRVDSDLDNTRTSHSQSGNYAGAGTGLAAGGVAGGGAAAAHHHNNNSSNLSNTPGYGGDNLRSSNYGPHDSNIANTTDPRVDSDLDNTRTSHSHHSGGNYAGAGTGLAAGGAATAAAGGAATHHHNTSSGLNTTSTGSNFNEPATRGYDSTTQSTNYGSHDSNIANKADSNIDGSRFQQDVHKGSLLGSAGEMDGDFSNGPTSTKTFEKAQQTGASGATGGGGVGGAGSSYNTRSTAGPHNSNIANKLDPRVDSDLDGSRTVGSQGQQRF